VGSVQPLRGADRETGLLDNQQEAKTRSKLVIFAIALASGVIRTIVAVTALVVAITALTIAGFLVSLPLGFGALALGASGVALMFGYGTD
jgi:uncharacterized membrane protein